MKETIHYIADIRYVSGITSDRYSSKRQVVEAHIRYVEKSADYEFGDKNLIVQNSDKYNKRVNSRVAGKTVFALPNDIRREEYEKWCKYIQSVISENFKVNPEYIYIAIHENHSLQEELGTKNLHAHVVFTPITRDGKAIQTKISDLKAIHQSWRQILAKEGYSIKKEQESIGKLGWKLRKDEEMLAAYKEYIQAKREQEQAVSLAEKEQEKINILSTVKKIGLQDAITFLEQQNSSFANRLLDVIVAIKGKKVNEVITILKQLQQNETDEYVKEYIDFLQKKAQEFAEKRKLEIEKRKREIQNLLAEKPLGEAIGIVRMLWKEEKDRALKSYLESLLNDLNRKAEVLKQEKINILSTVKKIGLYFQSAITFLEQQNSSFANRLLDVIVAVQGKKVNEVITILEQLQQNETDEYVKEYIAFLQEKAEEIKQEFVEKRKREIENLLVGKPFPEAIGIVRMLLEREKDRELKSYLEELESYLESLLNDLKSKKSKKPYEFVRVNDFDDEIFVLFKDRYNLLSETDILQDYNHIILEHMDDTIKKELFKYDTVIIDDDVRLFGLAKFLDSEEKTVKVAVIRNGRVKFALYSPDDDDDDDNNQGISIRTPRL